MCSEVMSDFCVFYDFNISTAWPSFSNAEIITVSVKVDLKCQLYSSKNQTNALFMEQSHASVQLYYSSFAHSFWSLSWYL